MFEPRLPRIITAADFEAMSVEDRRLWPITPPEIAEKYRARIALETQRMLRCAEYFLLGGKPWASPDLKKARLYFNGEFGNAIGYFDADTGQLVSLVHNADRLAEHIAQLRAGPKKPPVFKLSRGDVCLLISAEVPTRPKWDSKKNVGRIVVTLSQYTIRPPDSLPPCWFIAPEDGSPFLISGRNFECEWTFLLAKEAHLIPLGGRKSSLPLPEIPPSLAPVPELSS